MLWLLLWGKEMSKIKTIIREKAAGILSNETGQHEDIFRRKQLHTLAKMLKIKYPDGSKPRTKYEWTQALKSWYNTNNRIVTRPVLCEYREERTLAKIQNNDGYLMRDAAAKAAIYERNKNKSVHKKANSDKFLSSYEWRQLRLIALKKYGARCMCCGATPASGAIMNVDHIKPRKLFPQLALDIANLQVLCHECNHGKGNWDMTDWRSKENVSEP